MSTFLASAALGELHNIIDSAADEIEALTALVEVWKAKHKQSLAFTSGVLTEKLTIALHALRKIEDPQTYHHWHEEPYTRAGCFQSIAHEARKALGDLPEQISDEEKKAFGKPPMDIL